MAASFNCSRHIDSGLPRFRTSLPDWQIALKFRREAYIRFPMSLLDGYIPTYQIRMQKKLRLRGGWGGFGVAHTSWK